MSCLPYGITIPILQFYTKFYAFVPFTNKPYVHGLYTTAWLIVLLVILSTMFYWCKTTVDYSILALVTSQIVAHMIVLTEAFAKRQPYSTIETVHVDIFTKLEHDLNLNIKFNRMWTKMDMKLSSIILILISCLGLTCGIWTYQPGVRPLFWYSVLSKQALRVRSLQLICALMVASEHLSVLDRILQEAAAKNQKETTQTAWMASSNEEYRVVVALRTVYDQFYDLSILLNNCFGWSVLMISTAYFFEFVCNAYRIFTVTQKDSNWATLVANSIAIVTLVLLMTTLCWYAHQCFEKALSVVFALFYRLVMFLFLNNGFTEFIFATLDIWLRIFALIRLTTVSMVYEIYIICWIIVLITILLLMFIHNEMQDDYSIGSLVSCALFISQILSHIIALGESYLNGRKLKELNEGFERIDRVLKHKLQYTLDGSNLRKMLAQQLLWIHAILLTDTIVMTYTHQVTKHITVLYWYSFLSSQALRLRNTQLIVLIICVNVRLQVIRKIILKMVRTNSKNLKSKWVNMVALANDANIEQVASLKLVYNQLFKMVNLLNGYFGWSLLSICTSYFIDFITNLYWIFVAKITNGPYEVYILNGGLVVSLVLQLTVVCWHCQECENYSKYIGSSIFKLAKPLGNKRYNDLVSEFSLQALHQPFAVSAKEFFQLNLDLLGSMVGAIATYLVILIQFMFTERNGSKISVPNSYLSGAVADVMLKNQTSKN